MADLSFSFHWSQASSAIVLAASAVSAVAARSAIWDKASAASSAAVVNASAASDAQSAAAVASAAAAGVSDAASNALSKATVASAAVVTLDGTAIKSVPGVNSRAVHEVMMTSAGLIKYVYSSVAQA